jgi:hypothetical protein
MVNPKYILRKARQEMGSSHNSQFKDKVDINFATVKSIVKNQY